jgi:PIN domain nuclease of toxin-antitoxin system
VRLILDTHALLWFEGGDRRLSAAARTAIEAYENERLISAASVWEMAIKASRGRLELPSSVAAWVSEKTSAGYGLLHVTAADAAAVETLPWHHRDPFDRLLAAQAVSHGCALVSRDRQFRKYGVKLIW